MRRRRLDERTRTDLWLAIGIVVAFAVVGFVYGAARAWWTLPQ